VPVEAFLRWATQSIEADEIPHFFELAGRPVELGAWERETLKRALEPRGKDEGQELVVLAEGVGFQVKCLELIDRFDHGPMPPPAELPAFLESLVTDVAVGIALEREMQWSMNRAIGKGRLSEAKSLAAFRAKVVQSLSDLKGRIGSAELEEAERRADDLVHLEEQTELPGQRALEEEEPIAHNWATYGERALPTGLPPWLSEDAAEPLPEPPVESVALESRARHLLLLLVVLLVAYAVIMLPRVATPGPTILSLEQFSHVEPVTGVSARPPSVYVILDGPRWHAGTPDEQRQWLQELGQIAGESGYTGLSARTHDGVTAGEWMLKTGVRLTPRPAGAS